MKSEFKIARKEREYKNSMKISLSLSLSVATCIALSSAPLLAVEADPYHTINNSEKNLIVLGGGGGGGGGDNTIGPVTPAGNAGGSITFGSQTYTAGKGGSGYSYNRDAGVGGGGGASLINSQTNNLRNGSNAPNTGNSNTKASGGVAQNDSERSGNQGSYSSSGLQNGGKGADATYISDETTFTNIGVMAGVSGNGAGWARGGDGGKASLTLNKDVKVSDTISIQSAKREGIGIGYDYGSRIRNNGKEGSTTFISKGILAKNIEIIRHITTKNTTETGSPADGENDLDVRIDSIIVDEDTTLTLKNTKAKDSDTQGNGVYIKDIKLGDGKLSIDATYSTKFNTKVTTSSDLPGLSFSKEAWLDGLISENVAYIGEMILIGDGNIAEIGTTSSINGNTYAKGNVTFGSLEIDGGTINDENFDNVLNRTYTNSDVIINTKGATFNFTSQDIKETSKKMTGNGDITIKSGSVKFTTQNTNTGKTTVEGTGKLIGNLPGISSLIIKDQGSYDGTGAVSQEVDITSLEGSGTISNISTINLTDNENKTFGGSIGSGVTTLNKIGNSTQILSGDSSGFNGSVNIASGSSLKITHKNALGSNVIALNNSGDFEIDTKMDDDKLTLNGDFYGTLKNSFGESLTLKLGDTYATNSADPTNSLKLSGNFNTIEYSSTTNNSAKIALLKGSKVFSSPSSIAQIKNTGSGNINITQWHVNLGSIDKFNDALKDPALMTSADKTSLDPSAYGHIIVDSANASNISFSNEAIKLVVGSSLAGDMDINTPYNLNDIVLVNNSGSLTSATSSGIDISAAKFVDADPYDASDLVFDSANNTVTRVINQTNLVAPKAQTANVLRNVERNIAINSNIHKLENLLMTKAARVADITPYSFDGVKFASSSNDISSYANAAKSVARSDEIEVFVTPFASTTSVKGGSSDSYGIMLGGGKQFNDGVLSSYFAFEKSEHKYDIYIPNGDATYQKFDDTTFYLGVNYFRGFNSNIDLLKDTYYRVGIRGNSTSSDISKPLGAYADAKNHTLGVSLALGKDFKLSQSDMLRAELGVSYDYYHFGGYEISSEFYEATNAHLYATDLSLRYTKYIDDKTNFSIGAGVKFNLNKEIASNVKFDSLTNNAGEIKTKLPSTYGYSELALTHNFYKGYFISAVYDFLGAKDTKSHAGYIKIGKRF